WAPWLVGPAVALAGTGTIMLAEDIALSQVGDVTVAVVVDHEVEQKVVHNSRSRNRTVHTHTYSLEGTDGRPLEQPMVYRGEGGYDDIDIGDDITVLVDPQGRAETELADNVDIGADIAILVVGSVATIGAFGILVLVVGLNGRLHRHRRRIGVTAWGASAAPRWPVHGRRERTGHRYAGFCRRVGHPSRLTVICLGPMSPSASSDPPDDSASSLERRLSDLAPDGVCPAASVTRHPGGLFHH